AERVRRPVLQVGEDLTARAGDRRGGAGEDAVEVGDEARRLQLRLRRVEVLAAHAARVVGEDRVRAGGARGVGLPGRLVVRQVRVRGAGAPELGPDRAVEADHLLGVVAVAERVDGQLLPGGEAEARVELHV